MKIKKIQIGTKTEEEAFRGFKETFKKAAEGRPVKKAEGIFFENIETLRKFLTPKRIELIRTIHEQRPRSAYELAKLVNRDNKSVMTDITILHSLGLLELKRETEKKEKIKPSVDYDRLEVEIAV